MLPVELRVQKGVELLDKEKPEWRGLINPNTIDISSFDQCILGQVYGDYFAGKAALELYWKNPDDFGFTGSRKCGISDGDWQHDWAALNAEWRRVLTEGRAP